MWDLDEFARAAEITTEALATYVAESRKGVGPVLRRSPPDELSERLRLRRWISEGGMTPESYREFLEGFLDESTRMHHPFYMGHQIASPDFPAALAEFVHGIVNNPVAVYEMGAPGATVEFEVLRWMLDKAGFHSGSGVLTHGGSLANLTALLAARAHAVPDAWTEGVPRDLVLLVPPSAHYSVARAAGIMGLGARAVVPVGVDPLGRIDVGALPATLAALRAEGRRPLALVASAGATATGLHDDLRGLAGICRAEGVWLHVDAAHGASALLTEGYRYLLDGIDQADSIIWDAHKMLRTSALSAAVLVRREGDLSRAFQQEASYLFYGDQGHDLLGRAVECTKAEMGLKIFLNLAWRGERGLGDYVAARYATAHRFWELAMKRPDFVCPYEPESNIVCFRYAPGGRDIDHAALREDLLRDGTAQLTSVELAGVRHLRLVVMTPATDDHTLETLLDTVAEAAAARSANPSGTP
ncbi:pyridoxal phosphate-dependent decarboxylase family protein [Sinosporangium siamense]|uniref:Pyridoxal-dependent decarboxylase n=1 Tax=Sinosporangium siamense TaxID=1367973 RepID=A0A919RBF8_9ACTN|nr:pyridoxal-dependent decarboxylase [Sinosporangium siamense]GII90850.1 pyridoxal-dependent decarboxylase [Sinosporangium siamense]